MPGELLETVMEAVGDGGGGGGAGEEVL